MENPKKENLSKVVIKNSSYDFISNLIAKFGGMIFSIFILARLLGPELFGVYNLAFSVIAIFLTFTDLGIGSAATRYISEAVGKNDKKKARTYFKYFLKLKSSLAIIIILIIILIAKKLSVGFYNQPLLMYPLLFSGFYIFISSLMALPQTFLFALKDLRKIPNIQLIEQVSKILLSLVAIYIFSYEYEVVGIFLAMSISALMVFLYSFIIILRKDKRLIIGEKSSVEKPRVLKYTGFMALSSISLVFFAAIDTLMLAKFVSAAYIGYYRAALGLVLSVGALFSIRTILMPVFTQISEKRLKRGFEKVTKYNLIISVPAATGLILISKQIIPILYGGDYAPASLPLYSLAALVVIASLISSYKSLFSARERPELLAKAIIYALGINIVLNYILIKSLISYGASYAILGAGIATLLSRTFLLTLLSIKGRKELGISLFENKRNFIKPILASMAMIPFVLAIGVFVEFSLLRLPLQIIGGAMIYVVSLLLIKGITKKDLALLRYIPFFKN